tara:strand:- start:7889 stop:9754 length:1866 start_codon:yes stop_codon:yes gene_type:complete
MRSFLLLTICTLFSATSFAQKLAIGSFNKIIFEETFNFNSGQFPLSATSDNYIILDDGDLFMSRNISSDYSLFAKTPLKLNSYRVKTALKLGPSNNKTAYVGLLLNTQLDGSGTVSIEINAKNQYRLRQIQDGKPKYISGTRSNNGWVKAENLKGIEEYNYLDIVVHQGSFDIYLNYVYVDSYFVPDYQNGGMGFILSGSSKARVDFAFIYKQGEAVSFEEFTTTNQRLLEVEESLRKLIDEKNTLENNYNNSIDELILVKNKLAEAEGLTDALNIQINSAQSLLNDLNASISEKDENIESLIKDNKNLENTISEHAEIINKRNQSIENLEKKNTELSNNLDITNAEILSLNSDLSNSISENDKLTQSSNSKSDAIVNLKSDLNKKDIEINKLKKQVSSSSSEIKNLQSSISSLEATINSLNGKIENKQNDIATLDSKVSQLQKELNSKQKIISSLSSKNNAYIDSLSDFRNTNTTLVKTQNELKQIKEILSSTKTQVMNLIDEKQVLTTQLNEQKQIAAQFAESYRLEVQKNRQLQKEITFNQSEVNVSNNTKSNTIYRVQIGTFNQEMEFDGINDVTSIPTQNGDYIYITGKFDSYSEAKVRLMQVAELGYKDAYIVKF